MKIGGPKGPPPVAGPPSPDESARTEKAPTSFDKVLEEGGVTAAASSDLIADLAQKVRSGALSPAEAADYLVDTVVARRGMDLTPAARDQLRAALRETLTTDPVLATRLRRMES